MTNRLPVDPFSLKRLSKAHPYRLVWTLVARLKDTYGRRSYKSIRQCLDLYRLVPSHLREDRGASTPETAVTSEQAELLRLAVAATESLGAAIVEIGSYRGVTTLQLARATSRVVFAV